MAETETPAETLRRAAEALNVAALGAKTSESGRWYVRTERGHYPQSIADNASAVIVADTFEGPQHPQTVAPFIASMDPTFAFAVAAWLESVAVELADTPACVTDQAPMAVARAYLRDGAA